MPGKELGLSNALNNFLSAYATTRSFGRQDKLDKQKKDEHDREFQLKAKEFDQATKHQAEMLTIQQNAQKLQQQHQHAVMKQIVAQLAGSGAIKPSGNS